METPISQLEDILVQYALGPEAAEQHAQGKIGKRFLEPVAQALVQMSDHFTTARETLPHNYWQGPGRAAYLLYYLPVNFAKVWAILNELNAGIGFRVSGSGYRVLDLGCGPGTASLATLFFLAGQPNDGPVSLSFTLLDSSTAALHDAQALLRQAAALLNRDRETVRLSVETRAGNLAQLKPVPTAEGRSLIWIGNVLNETLSHGHEATWLEEILGNHLAAEGSAVLFEPALRETSRNLMIVRDRLLERLPHLNVFAPCTADGGCRMLRPGRERDWCHSEVSWKRPPLVAQLDAMTGLWKKSLKFSYATFRRDGRRLHQPLELGGTSAWRVVGDLLKEKGKEKIMACGPEQSSFLVRLKRDRSPANQVFHRLQRGEIVGSPNLPSAEQSAQIQVQAETELNVAGPFLRFEF